MENERMIKQQSLYDALSYYGLLTDLKIVEDKMRENEPLPTDKSSGVLKNFWTKNVLNETRRCTMTKLSEKKNNILNRIDEFKIKRKHSGTEYDYVNDNALLKNRIDEVFCGDNATIGKAYFALQLRLDNQIEFENEDVVYGEISKLLFNSDTVISDLYDSLQENYAQLIKAPLKSVQKVILKCLGVTALISVALPPLLIGGVAVTALTVPALLEGAFAAVGVGAALVVEEMAIYSTILLGGALLGTEIAKQIKVKNAKNSLRKLSPENLSVLLAIKATLIEYSKKIMSDEEIKSELDDCLKQLNDLRSDAEYLLIVERLDAEKSRKKIEICNNFTTRLASIVGL